MLLRCRERRFLPLLGILVGLMTVTIFIYCWLAPYPVALLRMSSMTVLERKMFAQHAINNTVVIVPVNSGMLKFADNLVCSLRATSFDPKNIVFWALDDGAEVVLGQKGFATYRDPSLFGVSNDANLFGNTPEYKRMMHERPKFFIDFLSSGHDVLMLDADTVFWQSPLDLVPDRESDVDAAFSTDAREFYQTHNAFRDAWRRGDMIPPVCNGLFWMRSNDKTIRIWREMLDVFEAGWRTFFLQLISFQDDQRGMDVLLNDGRAMLVQPYPDGIERSMVPTVHETNAALNIVLLDQTEVVNGHLLKNRRPTYDKNLERLRAEGRSRVAAHFNWNSEEITKEHGARAMGMFYLDDDGRCKLGT